MEKTYSIQGENFTLLPNDLSLLNKAAPMIARLRKLSYEYTKDIDLSPANEYRSRMTELSEAKLQLENILNEGKDDEGNELSDDKRNELGTRINELIDKLEQVRTEFNSDTAVQNLLKLKEELESYALIELLTDISFLKPVLKKILTGGSLDKINFSDSGSIVFIKDVVTDFFTVMNRSSVKL
jgi:hypothetical protein